MLTKLQFTKIENSMTGFGNILTIFFRRFITYGVTGRPGSVDIPKFSCRLTDPLYGPAEFEHAFNSKLIQRPEPFLWFLKY